VRFFVRVVISCLVLAVGASPALADSCSYPTAYPGDDAPKAQIAAWMAGGAVQAGLPGELPVIAALVESNVANVPQGDRTTAGYFQMKVDTWNSGDYEGFPDHPQLQLQWFIDQAQKVRKAHYAKGETTFGESDTQYGEWVADIERPPEKNRSKFQPRLDEARSLIASGCSSAPDAQMIPDSTLPALRVKARRFQGPARTGFLSARASCGNEDCLLRAAAAVAVPGYAPFRVSVVPRQVEQDQAIDFRLALTKRQRKLVGAAARAGECALGVIRVVAANDGGWRISASRTVFLGPRRLCAAS
jgi:hypothetical protein